MAKEFRENRVFINWSQNDSSKTMICVYSLRAREKPTVSFPLAWEELEELSRQDNPNKLEVIHSDALTRLEKNGDLFREIMTVEQKLPNL
jgi:bifunctional non-homologous end joining protein LigD